MKNTDIAKIRQLLKEAENLTSNISGKDLHPDIYCLIQQALALLPCPTCNGTGKTSKLFNECPECGCAEYTNENLAGEGYRQCFHCHQDWWTDTKYEIPCPDCQPKSCVCCEEITEENAHLHRNCGK